MKLFGDPKIDFFFTSKARLNFEVYGQHYKKRTLFGTTVNDQTSQELF